MSEDAEKNMQVFGIEHLVKSFGGNEVLHDISVDVDEGEVVAIIGPSGSGKSTLLRCATLLETMDHGTLTYDGEQVVTDNGSGSVYGSKQQIRAAKSKFGLVFQNFNLFPHYTVLKNVADPPIKVQKRPRTEAEAEARVLLEQMGLADKADAVPNELSGGQQQRVGIARALAMKPRILFFDEPTSALDPELTRDVLKIIRGLAEQHMTMVIVTHEMSCAHDVADRVVFMAEGRIIEEGTPEDVMEHPSNQRTKEFLANYSN